ncbi:MAG: Gfo/Idh/MocA family oxidoreductase [Planctomycetes bacterium]|nr:Gfo/Idh/MocA family oxidoreductase [Planctomycetota bacterium]
MTQGHGKLVSPVRLGIVGLGRFGAVHARTAARIAEADLVALVDHDEGRLSAWPESPRARRWTNLEQAVDASDAEAWIVAASTEAHVPLARTLLAAGKTVLIEKPLASDAALAESLRPWVRPDSANVMLGHVALFNSEFRALCDASRRRGPIVYIDCVRHRPAATLDAFPGEDPFHLTMVHDLYLLFAWMDGEEPTRLTGHVHRTDDGRIDLAFARLEWREGTVATLCASFLTPTGMASDGFDRMEVFGRGWAARITPNPRPFEFFGDRAEWPMGLEIALENESATGMLAELQRAFCRVARGVQPVPRGATYDDGLRMLRWMEQLAEPDG